MSVTIDHTKNIIEITGVSFSYAGNNTDEVLTNINLNIHRGDYLGIIGPNGGGKTTLLKLILGLVKPSRGTIKIFGQEIDSFKEWPMIGYVSQKATSFDINFPATVKEVVAMGRCAKIGLFRWPKKIDNEKVEEALKQVNLMNFRNRLIGDMSGGQQQRVFIARALAAEPEVIFLDEPTAGVDQEAQEQFYKLLQRLNKELGITLVLVSHDLSVVATEVTEIACVNKTLIYDSKPKDFIRRNDVSDLYGKGVKIVAQHAESH